MINILPCLLLIFLFLFTRLCGSTLPDLDHPFLAGANSSNDHLTDWISEASAPEYSPYLRTPNEFVPNIAGLLSKYYAGSRRRNSHFADLESYRQKLAYQQSIEGKQNYRPSPYQDHQAMHSVPEYDAAFLKKHDYSNEQNFGGWDTFSGGLNAGHGPGLAQVGQVVKKGKEAKALFILMAPLILLAVFGPILATQAMIPWVANGGLTSVSAIASSGKRKKRSVYDLRQTDELEKRLQLFLEVQDFIAKTGSADFAEEMGEAFLRCNQYTERRNKCLERIACEYTDETSLMDPAERRIAKMVFQNVLSNPMIPASVKGRLSKGSMFGKNHRGRCRNYWCDALDGPKRKS